MSRKRGERIGKESMDAIKKKILEAFTLRPGVTFSDACAYAKISHSEAYTWRKEDTAWDDEVIKARDKSDESAIDLAENRLLNAISKGDTTSTIFFLKTRGRKRGYIETKEFTGTIGSYHVEPTEEERKQGREALLRYQDKHKPEEKRP